MKSLQESPNPSGVDSWKPTVYGVPWLGQSGFSTKLGNLLSNLIRLNHALLCINSTFTQTFSHHITRNPVWNLSFTSVLQRPSSCVHFTDPEVCELCLSFELVALSLWPPQYHGHVCVSVCLSAVVCKHVRRGTWCLAFVYAAACLNVHGTGVWRSKDGGMMGRSLGLVIQFSGSGCKVRKCTEIELLGKLPGKSLFQCRNSALNTTPILGGGSGWLGSLPWDLPILCHFFILIPTALVLALVSPHHGGHPGQSMCPDSLWFIQHHFTVATDHFLRTDPASLILKNPALTPRPHLASKALQHCQWPHPSLQTPRGPEGQSSLTTSCLVPPRVFPANWWISVTS